MKKLFTLFLTLVLSLGVCFSAVACGGHTCTPASTWTKDATHHWKKCTDETCTLKVDYATHTYTNGICVCGAQNDLSYTLLKSDATQSKALAQLDEGTADVAIVDEYVALHYFQNRAGDGVGANKSILNITHENAQEEFVFLTRKDSDFPKYFNAALYHLQEVGVNDLIKNQTKLWKLADIAELFNLSSVVKEIPNPNFDFNTEPEEGSDFFNIKYNNTTGWANFAFSLPYPNDEKSGIEPLGWQTHAGIDGFSIFVAQAVFQILGIEVYQAYSPCDIITWDRVQQKLNDGSLDLVCGPISTDLTYFDAEFEEDKAITELFDVTTSYMTNRQVMVVKNDKVATYPDLASLKTARFAVEQYSKAETLIKGALKTAILG